jgi:V-type H+-transporting ATPase subunit a
MSFAICLQVPNHLRFKDYRSIYAEFIPQMLFMQSIFGYLVVCIIYKWSVDWSQPGLVSPPGLLNMLIYMFLSPGTVNPEEQLYPGQAFLQTALVLLALVCVPWMLCLKPYLIIQEHKKTAGQGYEELDAGSGAPARHSTSDEQEEEEIATGIGATEMMAEEAAEDGEHGFDVGEIIIHQVIHTIEFCLGASRLPFPLPAWFES